MMLVYNLPRTEAIFERFGGIAGSAYFVGGFGMTALTANNIVVVPIRSGVGLRLGANVGYLKFTTRTHLEPVLSIASVASKTIEIVTGYVANRSVVFVARRTISV